MKSIEELRSTLEALRSEIISLAEADELTEVQEARYNEANVEFDELRGELEAHEAREARLAEIRDLAITRPESREAGEDKGPEVIIRKESTPADALSEVRAFDAPEVRDAKLRDAALRAIEAAPYMTADQQTEAERKLGVRGVSQHVLATSGDDYMRGFAKASTGNTHLLSDGERNALERAMSLTDANGGFMVPFTLDPTIILNNNGTLNPFRRIARVVSTTTDTWSGVSSAGVNATWYAEGAQVSDDAPTLALPTITPQRASAFVPVSYEAFQDIANLAQEVVAMFADAKDRLEGTAFATGTGSGQPKGIVTAISAVTASRVTATTNNSFGDVDVYKTYEALPVRYRGNASWAANIYFIDLIRRFGTANNYSSFTSDLTADGVSRLIGRPLYEVSDMVSSIGAGDDHALLIGDFSRFYIVDRIGLSVEFVPNLFGANGRPTGQRGWMAHWRVGSDAVDTNAFRVLRV